MNDEHRYAEASMEALYRIFTVPEVPHSTLGRVDQLISQNVGQFLQEHIVATEKDLTLLEKDFSTSDIPEKPMFVSQQADFLLDKVVSQSVHTASPSFIGHMTSALPYFMLPLSRIMIALNQNLVKIETSKAFTPLERQTLAMMHRLIFEQDELFYQRWMHEAGHALGSFCSGGTVANLTALWVARNQLFKPTQDFPGIIKVGVFGALKHHGYNGMAVLVSERGHYSLAKAADVLGLGRENLIAVKADAQNRLCLNALRKEIAACRKRHVKIMAIVGVAGTSETGSVDDLEALADIASEINCHYHVDAAWGGPTLFSDKYRHLLAGIARADSVTIDAHKQLYVPMGAGLVLFKDPTAASAIAHHAEYIIRKGAKDLGSHTLEGSRPGLAMLLQSGLKIIGRRGYALLIDQGIEKARAFAAMIEAAEDFELVAAPTLNILCYRYLPVFVRETLASCSPAIFKRLHESVNALTKRIQKIQRAQGKSFVSRTRLMPEQYHREKTVVFRAVLANPLTTQDILKNILDEQRRIANSDACQAIMNDLRTVCEKGVNAM